MSVSPASKVGIIPVGRCEMPGIAARIPSDGDCAENPGVKQHALLAVQSQ